MSVTAILFDLDGTLLPMDQETFISAYFGLLARKIAPLGYEPRKLLSVIWEGTKAMIQNGGECTNEEAFWNHFIGVYGSGALEHKPGFDEFYRVEFQQVQASCGFEPEAARLIAGLKERGYRLVLATNPLFPQEATFSRIRWAGLQPEDFEFYTTFEDIGYCKPNPDYYREVLRRGGLDAADCLMVGNDVAEDMMAGAKVGLRGFLLTDCLINTPGADVEQYPHGSFDELDAYIETLLNEA